MKKRAEDTEIFMLSHARGVLEGPGWDTIFHNWKCHRGYVHVSVDDDDDDDDEPCRCCIAQLFRAEGKSNPCNVACRVCFNWKGELPGTKEFYKD